MHNLVIIGIHLPGIYFFCSFKYLIDARYLVTLNFTCAENSNYCQIAICEWFSYVHVNVIVVCRIKVYMHRN